MEVSFRLIIELVIDVYVKNKNKTKKKATLQNKKKWVTTIGFHLQLNTQKKGFKNITKDVASLKVFPKEKSMLAKIARIYFSYYYGWIIMLNSASDMGSQQVNW